MQAVDLKAYLKNPPIAAKPTIVHFSFFVKMLYGITEELSCVGFSSRLDRETTRPSPCEGGDATLNGEARGDTDMDLSSR